jgi:RNA polymerase sigma-70 factor, ECF subfamily
LAGLKRNTCLEAIARAGLNDEGRSALAFALEQCASGDAGAFAAIVRSQQRMVFSLAYHCLHDRAVADELAQDVFLELHKNLGLIRSPEHLVFWLRKVASRRAIDEARRRSRHLSLSLADAPEPAAEDRNADPVFQANLDRVLARLPEQARLAVILRYQEDLEPADIADVLGIPVNTVKSQLQRSLAVLREKLCRSAKGANS